MRYCAKRTDLTWSKKAASSREICQSYPAYVQAKDQYNRVQTGLNPFLNTLVEYTLNGPGKLFQLSIFVCVL